MILDKNMMNRMVNKEFAQEIAAVIRTAQNGDRLPELLKHYHQRDVAKAVTLLTDAERERLFRQLDARTLAEIFPYLDDAARFLAELPADLAAAVITDMDTADALDMLRELPAEKKQALAAHLDDDTRKDVRRLLAFHQEEIGSRMSGNFVCIPDTLTVCGAMNELVRQASIPTAAPHYKPHSPDWWTAAARPRCQAVLPDICHTAVLISLRLHKFW